jgi:phage terminase small subunit
MELIDNKGNILFSESHTQLGAQLATELLPKAEAFAQMYVGEGNAADAYRTCYEVGADTLPNTVKRLAHKLRHSAPVARRIRELQAAAADTFVVSVAARMADLHDIATADASELSRVVTECCRYCYGEGAKPQWFDEAELAAAVDRAVASQDSHKPLPMPEFGGFGFNPTLAPVDDCRRCHGHGVPRVLHTPTDQLSPQARKLYKGARQKADGSIEIETENRLTAADQLARLAGFYVERSESRSLNLSLSATTDYDPATLLAQYKAGAQR